MDNKRLITIFVIVFIDLLGFSIILPLLPFFAETYGASPTLIGFLVASYAAAQLVGAPVLGRLSDRFGRRPILLISILGTMVGFLMLGFANSLWMLFASRLVDGFTGGNISVAQAYITDITDSKNRARGLGLIGAAFGLGFIFGPAIGGILSEYSYSLPAFVAAGFSLLAFAGVFFFLPESLTEEQRGELAKTQKEEFSLKNIWHAISKPRVGPLLTVRFFYGLAFALFTTIFTLFALYRLNLDARANGFVLTYIGILLVIVQAGLVGWLAKRFDEYIMIFICCVLVGLALLFWAFSPTIWVLLLTITPLAFAGGVLNTLLNSTLSKSVYPEEAGGTLGLSASLESLTRVIAPSVGGFLIGSIGTWAPGVAGALIMVITSVYAWLRLVKNPDPPLPERDPVEPRSMDS